MVIGHTLNIHFSFNLIEPSLFIMQHIWFNALHAYRIWNSKWAQEGRNPIAILKTCDPYFIYRWNNSLSLNISCEMPSFDIFPTLLFRLELKFNWRKYESQMHRFLLNKQSWDFMHMQCWQRTSNDLSKMDVNSLILYVYTPYVVAILLF